MKIIALDIGGTAVKSGLVDNGVLKEHRETPTPAAEGGQAVVALAKKLIAAYLPEGADGIGIGGDHRLQPQLLQAGTQAEQVATP